MNYTSFEQSQHLIELGLDKSTADMYWSNNRPNIGQPISETLPCWSIGALIQIIPNSVYYDNILHFWHISRTGDFYQIVGLGPISHGSLLDVLYQLICWLLENKYI